MTCRTCKYLMVPEGERRLAGRVYGCDYPLPEVKWPASVTLAYGFQSPRKRLMAPGFGAGCSTYEKIVKVPK